MPTVIDGSGNVNSVQVALASQAEAEAGTATDKLMNPLRTAQAVSAQAKTVLNASGDPPIYACRAWANFDGTGPNGFRTIRASGNIASVEKTATGTYTVTFTTAMPDANYSVVITSQDPGTGANGGPAQDIRSTSTTSFGLRLSRGGDNLAEDSAIVCIAVFR